MKLLSILNKIKRSNLGEGKHDPHIFKAIFMCGTPGSGKSTISKKISSGTGLKIVNFDIFHEWYLRNKKEIDLGRFDKLIDSQLKLYMDGRLGIIIDKTSQKYEDILKLKIMLESIGYDTSMIFVNTDLNVAKQRVIQRYEKTGRSVDVNYIENTFKNIQNNLGKYQSLFNNNFFIIDNTSDSNFLSLEKMVNKFINSPVNNHIAKKFLNS